MPLDSARLEELKSNLALARKRPLAFGLCLGKSPETTVLLNHKTKDPETVGRLAKKEGETSKVVFGMMSVGGKNLDLSIACDPIPGLARKTKEMLKAAGLKFKVRILDASGNLLEENSDDEDQDGPAPGEASPQGSAPEPDPQQVRWDETRPRVEAALDKAGGQADLTRARAAWGAALARASAGDLGGALQAADVTLREIATAVEARRSGPGDEAARWAAEAARLAPLVEAAMRSALPEAKKVSAYWDFAQSKAKAPVPDFGAVMKTLPLLEKLAREVLEKARRMTGTDTPAGGGGSSASPAGLAKSGKPAKPAPPPVTAAENDRLAKLSDEELAKTKLVQRDTKDLFDHDYMQALREEPTKGAGNPTLKSLMREIDKGGMSDDRRKEVMTVLASIVGNPPSADALDADYGRFLLLRRQQATIGTKKGETVPGLNEEMHPDFMASRSQLLFGKVLGDAFGIHEVFASLLSPTGGLVGPGNWLVEPGQMGSKDGVKAGHLAPDNPVALHGTVHDAAGYLLNFHEEGPGYNYRDSKIEVFGTTDPLSGQASGIAYWIKEAGPEYVERMATDAVVAVEKKLGEVRDEVRQEIDLRVAEAKRKAAEAIAEAKRKAEAAQKKAEDLARQAEKKARELAEKAEKKAVEVGDAIRSTAGKAKDAAVETYEAGKKKLGEIADDAKKKLDAAWDLIWR